MAIQASGIGCGMSDGSAVVPAPVSRPSRELADAYAALLTLERAAGAMDPYRQISRLVHFVARASSV